MEKEFKQQAITFGTNWGKEWKRFMGYKKMKGPGEMEKHVEAVVRLMDEVTELRKENKKLKAELEKLS